MSMHCYGLNCAAKHKVLQLNLLRPATPLKCTKMCVHFIWNCNLETYYLITQLMGFCSYTLPADHQPVFLVTVRVSCFSPYSRICILPPSIFPRALILHWPVWLFDWGPSAPPVSAAFEHLGCCPEQTGPASPAHSEVEKNICLISHRFTGRLKATLDLSCFICCSHFILLLYLESLNLKFQCTLNNVHN